MQIIVTKQIGIEADSIEQGIAKVANGDGQTITVSASARPQPISATPAGQVLGSARTVQTPGTPKP